ncbi:hypothetical protein AQUCO_08300090v1 [Aquilegia coerulea]|uniref:GPI mannosyltransferase 1 n=1 Tax=Aquilegia coerulea TaxID=218851 RepID=A0A2G5C785_AQUCA|nr:hypothetical protein AQUCO_08300090v1 [Aquilegia coerulea]
MSSDAGNEFFEKALRSPKRSRTEEAEKGFEKNETKEKEKVKVKEEEEDDDDDYVEEVMRCDFNSLVIFSVVLRIVLIIYGEWQDTHMEVRYTDVDYLVFSDASSLMASGFLTHYLLWEVYTFLIFIELALPIDECAYVADILVGLFIRNILKLRGVPENLCLISMGAWLFNPFTFTIGTRGNCELVLSLLTRERILFGLLSASVFFFWTWLFFYLYQWEFLNEALFYHLTRTDPRHNFSIYFYHIYLHHEREFSILEKLVSFLPQLTVQLVLIFRYAQDLPFCLFVQTVAFVAFNKVVTAQYFVWFFCLLPLLLPWSNMNLRWEGLSCILIWMGTQLHWLMWGYMLEFKGKNVFVQLWVAGLLFLAANTWVLIKIMCRHKFSPIFIASQKTSVKSARKLQ